MSVLVTGASGRVGSALLEYQGDNFDIECFDREPHSTYETKTGDVASYPEFNDAATGVDHLVHLAGASAVDSSWPLVLQSNLIGGYNCLEVARRSEIETVVLASTNHVIGIHEQERAPELYDVDHNWMADRNTSVRPDSLYAVSKLFLEGMGRFFVENYKFPRQVYALRIGSVRGPSEDHPYADAERDVREGRYAKSSEAYWQSVQRMKSTWQSRRDIASMIAACLNDTTIEYDVFYGVSDNDRRWMDIEHAKRTIGYDPMDNAEKWTEPPAEDV